MPPSGIFKALQAFKALKKSKVLQATSMTARMNVTTKTIKKHYTVEIIFNKCIMC